MNCCVRVITEKIEKLPTQSVSYLIGAVCVGDPRKGLQGRSDHEGTRSGAVLLSLTQQRQRQTKLVQHGETLTRHHETSCQSKRSPHHVRLQAGHQLTDAGLQTVLHPLHLLQGRVGQDLWGETVSETHSLQQTGQLGATCGELLPSGSWSSWLTGWWWAG